jgi:hypothetical protein
MPFEYRRRRRRCVWGLLVFLSLTSWGADGTVPPPASVRAQRIIQGPAGDPFSLPSDAAVNRNGDLYVLDGVNHRVVVYDRVGTFRFMFGVRGSGKGQLLSPLGIGLATDGTVYVADSGNHRIQAFTGLGEALHVIPLPTSGRKAPPDPTDVALNPDQTRLYIVDNDNHVLDVYNLTDRCFEAVWGSPGQGRRQFRYPFLIDTSAQGYIFIVEPINTRVQVLNPKGKFVSFVGNWGIQAGQLFRPKGVAVLGEIIFVTDSYLGRIQMFTMAGEFLGMLSDTQGAPVTLITPTGITVDTQERILYVVELKANRICCMALE